MNVTRIVSKLLAPTILFGFTAGCRAPHPPIRLIVAIDVSDPAEGRLVRYASAAYELESGLGRRDELIVFLFGHGDEMVYEGPGIPDRDAFNEKIASKLAYIRPAMASPGTLVGGALRSVADEVASSQVPSCAVLETDGGVEDASAAFRSEIGRSLRRLRSSSKLRRLLLLGVDDEWREKWSAWLRPLGGLVVVRGMNDYQDLATGFVEEAAR